MRRNRVEGLDDWLPPHSAEAEAGVLGCIFLDPEECLGRARELFGATQPFYDIRHASLFRVMCEMADQSPPVPVDLMTLLPRLRAAALLDEVGGIAYLSALPDLVPSAANLDHYAAIVRDKHRLRKLLATMAKATEQVWACVDHADELIAKVESEVSQLTESEVGKGEQDMKTLCREALHKIEEWSYHRGEMQLEGLSTGPQGNYLDKMVGGLAPTDMVIVAGRPGSGKTSLALNWVKHVAKQHVHWEPLTREQAEELEARGEKVSRQGEGDAVRFYQRIQGLPVGVFSLEMTADSLVMRLIFDEAGVDMAQYRQGFKGKEDDEKLAKAALRLSSSKIYIDDLCGQTINQIAAKARRMAKQRGIKLFVLDYLQLIDSEDEFRGDRVRELEKAAKKIMALKKQLQVPFVVLAQMNRNIETTERPRRPVMSDLKDCGAIEQAADLIVFTYKLSASEVTKSLGEGPSDQEVIDAVTAKKNLKWSEVPYRVDLVVAKHRDGPTGECQMVFQKNLCRFVDWHQWKVQNGVEKMKAGEREKVMKQREAFDEVPD